MNLLVALEARRLLKEQSFLSTNVHLLYCKYVTVKIY